MASAGRVRASLGIEVGRLRTTGVLLAGDGRELARSVAEHPPLQPRGTQCEQDPAVLWAALQQVVARLKASVEVDLVGLGLDLEHEFPRKVAAGFLELGIRVADLLQLFDPFIARIQYSHLCLPSVV